MPTENLKSNQSELILDLNFEDLNDFQQAVDIYSPVPLQWNPDYKVIAENKVKIGNWFPKNRSSLKCLFKKNKKQIPSLHIILKSRHGEQVVCNVQTLWVQPEHRGSGFGSMLKCVGEKWCIIQGDKKISTHVYVDNLLMPKITKKKGFYSTRFKMQKELKP